LEKLVPKLPVRGPAAQGILTDAKGAVVGGADDPRIRTRVPFMVVGRGDQLPSGCARRDTEP
jgi:hypothetical protein